MKRSNGEGTIYHRKNGSWQALVSLGGKRLCHTAKTKRECQDWLKQTIGQVDKGMTLDSTKTTLGEFIDDWLEIKSSKIRINTQLHYASVVRLHIKPILGTCKLKELNAAKIQALYNQLRADSVGTREIRATHIILHGCLEHARKLGLIAQNWSELTEVPRPEKRAMTVWTESQVSQFLSFVPRDQLLFRMAFATGMRRAEIIGLKWEDLDWPSGLLTIRRQVIRKPGGGYSYQEPKTERSKRSIRLGPGLMAALKEHYEKTLPLERAIAGDRWKENDLIFPNRNGTPRTGVDVYEEFEEITASMGLPKIRFHDIRHTAASIMLLHGEPPVRVAGILGQSVNILLTVYAHWIPDDQATASALMDQVTSPTVIDLAAVAAALQQQN